jgi:hypothetical protein
MKLPCSLEKGHIFQRMKWFSWEGTNALAK